LLRVPGGLFLRLAESGSDSGEAEIEPGHPDLLVIRPPPEKATIRVEQIRGLIEFLHLKSHQGGARVVLIWPAEAMNPSAANSLLKTLEEPPPGSALVLVAPSAAALPATILSRCHRERISTPPREIARAWLESEHGEGPWDLLLEFAVGAPLEALALHRAGFDTRAEDYAEDLRRLRKRCETPVAVAKRWAKADPDPLLRWLYLQAAQSISLEAAGGGELSALETGNSRLQNRGKPLNMRLRFERLREVEDVYRGRAKAMNFELQFTSLLQRWYGDAADGDRS
jgi:DNA polymerase-3 subunit delta'